MSGVSVEPVVQMLALVGAVTVSSSLAAQAIAWGGRHSVRATIIVAMLVVFTLGIMVGRVLLVRAAPMVVCQEASRVL